MWSTERAIRIFTVASADSSRRDKSTHFDNVEKRARDQLAVRTERAREALHCFRFDALVALAAHVVIPGQKNKSLALKIK